ncbi:hypothetical protein FN846DRAFT_889586 [Sphaerosporella brunnea]|uniref:Uncharacterized protein n=1 Tax=Sphaerosporella brunnea TaxID=1250544 RepID=A0A5J5F009_9PEZI|nr:hypothetical protein FN846DRAFT_889586 [Sphaerosporella brunnea]
MVKRIICCILALGLLGVIAGTVERYSHNAHIPMTNETGGTEGNNKTGYKFLNGSFDGTVNDTTVGCNANKTDEPSFVARTVVLYAHIIEEAEANKVERGNAAEKDSDLEAQILVARSMKNVTKKESVNNGTVIVSDQQRMVHRVEASKPNFAKRREPRIITSLSEREAPKINRYSPDSLDSAQHNETGRPMTFVPRFLNSTQGNGPEQNLTSVLHIIFYYQKTPGPKNETIGELSTTSKNTTENNTEQHNKADDSAACHCVQGKECGCSQLHTTLKKNRLTIIIVSAVLGGVFILPLTVIAFVQFFFGWKVSFLGIAFHKGKEDPPRVFNYFCSSIMGGDLPLYRAKRDKQRRRQNRWYRRYWQNTAAQRAEFLAKFGLSKKEKLAVMKV